MKLSKDVGIDLGTANTLVYVKDKGIVVREPSVVAVNKYTNEIIAVGNQAKEMIGRTPGCICAIRPLRNGVITDFEMTQVMLKYFIKKAVPNFNIFKPRVVICVPSGVTEIEKRAVQEAVLQIGAKEVYLIEEPIAAAIGAGLPIDRPQGNMIVDIGGGTCEVAVVSMDGIVVSESLRLAGDNIDRAIVDYIKCVYNMDIGEKTAEQIKVRIGSAYTISEQKTMKIKGRNTITGLPKTIELKTDEIREAIKDILEEIVDVIKSTLEKTPPDLAMDIAENGIVVAGGGALISGIHMKICEATGVPVNIASTPLDCVVYGAGKILDGIRQSRKMLISSRSYRGYR